MGDSLSAAYNIPLESGWVNLLAKDMTPDYEVINASVSGETTSGGLARLPDLLEAHNPDWVIIALGGNDGLRGFPLQLLRSNLDKLGGLVVQAGAKPIYFGIRIPPNYGARYTQAFEQVFPTVAEQKSAPYLNLFQEQFYSDQSLLQRDGIHPTEEAQPLIRDMTLEFLQKTLTEGQ